MVENLQDPCGDQTVSVSVVRTGACCSAVVCLSSSVVLVLVVVQDCRWSGQGRAVVLLCACQVVWCWFW